MNRHLIVGAAAILCGISLAGCAAATPVAIPPSGGNPIATMPAAAAGAPASDGLACGAGSPSASVTPELTEGPFFKANSQERASLLESNTAGTKLVITGTVYGTDCKPVPNALLDFWQADASGAYDNSGYNLRGHQLTDANGHYQLTTVVPGLYTGRTEHIHVKVQAPGGRLITTQLFFPGVAQNDSDGIYNPALLMIVEQGSDRETAQFDFVVPTD